MTYDEALKYIHGVSNFFCKPGLERTIELCRGLGDPQKELKFIHVGGTNGKGSVSSMLSSVLTEAGYRVGLYTSPYILEFNERMRVNGKNIDNERLALLTERVKTVADKMTDSPTEFELITAIAFLYFKEENCDVVVLEVGMGGRLDATNIIDSPLLSIITGIALDHTAFLGDSIEKIAGEKAGIIKKSSVALWGGEDGIAEAVIRDSASIMQTKLYKTDYSALKIKSYDLSGTVFDYRGRENLKISLLGEYQPRNASIVIDAIDLLNERGLSVSEEALTTGLWRAAWPARFEVIGRDPTVIFDGAHNPQGVRAAVNSIKAYYGSKRVVILTGVLSDKDYQSIVNTVCEVASSVYTLTPDNPRALAGSALAEIYRSRGIKATHCSSVDEALKMAVEEAEATQTALICLGSLYLYTEVFSAYKKAFIDK